MTPAPMTAVLIGKITPFHTHVYSVFNFELAFKIDTILYGRTYAIRPLLRA
jgi:hypothetical protein